MRSQTGIALVIALGLLVVMSLLVLGVFFTTQLELWITRNDTTSVQAFYAAEAGLAKYKAALFNQYIWQERSFSQGGWSGSTVCYSSFANGIDWNRNGRLEGGEGFTNGRMLLAQNEPVYDANGNPVGRATVELYRSGNPRTYTLVSHGTSGGAKSRVQATFYIETPSPLNLAIFAGGGAANRWLNGGATIRGGLYIEGDPANPDAEVISTNGNFSLLNWYDLTGTPLSAYVTPEDQRAQDLCASLRVRWGKVSVGGSTLIGEPDNKVKGVFVNRGREDILGQSVDVCQQNKGVCTEALGPFDLSNPPSFPTLDGPGGCGASWRECLKREASLRVVRGELPPIQWPLLANPPVPPPSCMDAFSGSALTLKDDTVDCSYTLPGGERGGFKYTPGKLEVYGTVVLEGFDVILDRPIEYRTQTGERPNGGLAVLARNGQGGNLDINGNLLPDPTQGRFPRHVLGLVAEGSVYQRGPYVAAPLYAGKTFRIVKDNALLGSVITNEFCTTSAGNTTACNAGQKAQVIHVNTAGNRPQALGLVDQLAGRFTFQVLSYERR
ncbi:MAG: PilX N-terminal domain-containing pilus assembly protein [Thermaceae bacterium]